MLLPAALLLWTMGATPIADRNAGICNFMLPRDAMGCIITSPILNVPEHPNVFAIGDCSRLRNAPYPATVQVAMQQAMVAAWNVYATLMYGSSPDNHKAGGKWGRSKLPPFKFLYLGEMMTLGTGGQGERFSSKLAAEVGVRREDAYIKAAADHGSGRDRAEADEGRGGQRRRQEEETKVQTRRLEVILL